MFYARINFNYGLGLEFGQVPLLTLQALKNRITHQFLLFGDG